MFAFGILNNLHPSYLVSNLVFTYFSNQVLRASAFEKLFTFATLPPLERVNSRLGRDVPAKGRWSWSAAVCCVVRER